MFILALLITTALMAGCSSFEKTVTPQKSLWATIKEKGSIKIGTEGTYPPFSFKDEKGILTGYDVEVISEVSKRLNLKVEFVSTEWKSMFTGLDSGRFDIIANQVGINEERLKKYDFSIPYTISGAQLIVNKDTEDIVELNDLKGRKVGASQGSNYSQLAEEAGAKLTFYAGSNEIIADLEAKRIEVAINDRLFLSEYMMKNPDKKLKLAGKTFNTSQMAFTFRKGSPELVQKVNETLDEMGKDGTLEKISKKWFGEDVSK